MCNKPHLSRRKSPNKRESYPLLCLQITVLSIAVAVVSVLLYYGYLETRINTPLSTPKIISDSYFNNPSRYWGTYRPGVYFGTSVRHPHSPITGMLWHTEGHLQNNVAALRHWCDQSDGLSQYGWQIHNGRDFGLHLVKDKLIKMETFFVKSGDGKYGGDWTARIKVNPKGESVKNLEVMVFYYFSLNPDDQQGELLLEKGANGSPYLTGHSETLGSFTLEINAISGEANIASVLSTKSLGVDQIKETVLRNLRVFNNKKGVEIIRFPRQSNYNHENVDIVVFQVVGYAPFEIDVVFRSESSSGFDQVASSERISETIKHSLNQFDAEFESKFRLREKGFNKTEIDFAKAAMSNMIGGIGYFYGSSKVEGVNNIDPVPYWKAPLYTAVPSRSFFPRGFLWDEGFHNLLISKWDRGISMDIIGHWFDLMNSEGWIPREQILGKEALARVPKEFVIQNHKAANPPTFALTLQSIMSELSGNLKEDNDIEYLNNLWHRLKVWYHWYNTSQVGEVPGTYRWRGRVVESSTELNPKTLTSGLDDYPRASHPTSEERHLDLRCWMALASKLMADIAKLINKDGEKYEASYKFLSDNGNLDMLHWSYFSNGYMDFGLHTDDIKLKKVDPKRDKIRVVQTEPRLRFVDSFGYVSFFPLFLQIIDPDSPKLWRILEDLTRPELLWTPYGLRSLARNSVFYNKWNTQHDPPYWRGSIWINMNFLAVRALKYYSQQNGPSKELASEIYKQLRRNLIDNIFREYNRTGYLWEHYNDKTGHGEGCCPFTGWTALIVLIMAENY